MLCPPPTEVVNLNPIDTIIIPRLIPSHLTSVGLWTSFLTGEYTPVLRDGIVTRRQLGYLELASLCIRNWGIPHHFFHLCTQLHRSCVFDCADAVNLLTGC